MASGEEPNGELSYVGPEVRARGQYRWEVRHLVGTPQGIGTRDEGRHIQGLMRNHKCRWGHAALRPKEIADP